MLIKIREGHWVDSSLIKRIYISHLNYFELDRLAFCVMFDIGDESYSSDEFEHKTDAINFARCVADRINNLEESS